MITESEFRAREREVQESFAPVGELAYFLTSLKEDWADDDLENKEKYIVKPEVWERVRRENERGLSRLIAAGVLQAKGKGKLLKISRRSFHDWRSRDVPVSPEWGSGYDVRSNSEAEQVAHEQEQRAGVRKALAQVLTRDEAAPWWTQLFKLMPKEIKKGLKAQWGDLRALELALDQVAGEFDGENVLKPLLRQDIEDAKQKALDLHGFLQDWTGEFELPQEDSEAVRQMRELIDLWADNHL